MSDKMCDCNQGRLECSCRDFIGEVIAEANAKRAPLVCGLNAAVLGVQNVNSAMSTIDALRQQLADVSNERDEALRLLRGVHTGDLFGPEDWEIVNSFLSKFGGSDNS